MTRGANIHDGTGVIARDPARGVLLQYGTVVPAANTAGYSPGCEFLKIDGTTVGTVKYVNIGTKAAANFVQAGLDAAIAVNFVYGDATPIDTPFFVADRNYTILSAVCRPTVAGTDVGAVTAQLRKTPSGTSIAAGTLLHSGSLNLKGTVDTNQTLTLLTGATIVISSGNALGLDVTGTPTAARGVVSVLLIPA